MPCALAASSFEGFVGKILLGLPVPMAVLKEASEAAFDAEYGALTDEIKDPNTYFDVVDLLKFLIFGAE